MITFRHFRLAQERGAGEWRDIGHAGGRGDRRRGARGRRADGPDQGEDAFLDDQSAGVGDGGFRFIGIVQRQQVEPAAEDAAPRVRLAKRRLDPERMFLPRSWAGPLKAADWPNRMRSAETPGASAKTDGAAPKAAARKAARAGRAALSFIPPLDQGQVVPALPPGDSSLRPSWCGPDGRRVRRRGGPRHPSWYRAGGSRSADRRGGPRR